MATTPKPSVVTFDRTAKPAAAPSLPPDMADRADARELREFALAFRAIRNPENRRRILDELENATQSRAVRGQDDTP